MSLSLVNLPGAYQYNLLREKYCLMQVRDREANLEFNGITEKLVQYLWAAQTPKGNPYKTVNGESIEVVFSGCWNAHRGPDFTSAKLRINDKLICGDVEIHLYSSDWYAHKHHLNSDYNNIILHVAFWSDDNRKTVQCADKQEHPNLILSPFLPNHLKEIGQLTGRRPIALNNYRFGNIGKCYKICRDLPAPEIQQLVDMSGEFRLWNKVELLAKSQVSAVDDDEILYQQLMQALGYRNNMLSFRSLAGNVPYKSIKQLIQAYPPEKHPLIIQAILLYHASFLQYGISDVPETEKYLDQVKSIVSKLSLAPSSTALAWNLSGVRPVNYPQRRIAAISYFLSRYTAASTSMANELISLFNSGNKPEVISRKLQQMFYIPGQGYWGDHYNFTAHPMSKPIALIGRARASEIIINVVIPCALLYAMRREDSHLIPIVMMSVRKLPPPPDNYIALFMRYRLFKMNKARYGQIVNTALRQQGLIQIFNDFCHNDNAGCESCVLLKHLAAN